MSKENDQNIEKLSTVINDGIESAFKNVHTAMPGIIESFDETTQTAKIKPVFKRIFIDRDTGEKTVKDLPPLINVPVMFPNAGGFCITFPVKQGNECLVVFSERAIDDWYDTGESRKQNQKRFFDLSDGIAIIGLTSKPNVISDFDDDGLTIRNEAGTTFFKIDDDGKIIIQGNVEFTGDLDLTGDVSITGNLENTGDVDIIGNVETTGTLKNNEVNVGSTHIHNQPPDSDGDTQSPTTVPV